VRSSLGLGLFDDEETTAKWMPHQIDGLSLLLPLLLRSMPASTRPDSGHGTPGIRDAVDSLTKAAGSWLQDNPCPVFTPQEDATDMADKSGPKLISLFLTLPLLVGLEDISIATMGIERFISDASEGKRRAVLNHLWALLLSSDDYERKTGLALWFQGLLEDPLSARSKL
jgi:hypothetical protein